MSDNFDFNAIVYGVDPRQLPDLNAKENQYLTEVGYVDGTLQDIGQRSIWGMTRKITIGQFASLLDDMVNRSGDGWRLGIGVGLLMRNTHRTLQASLIKMCFGILIGISKQKHSDPRNEQALNNAKQVAQMFEEGKFEHQPYI